MEVQSLIFQIISLVITLSGGIWFLSSRVERVSSQLESHSERMEDRFVLLDRELNHINEQLREGRKGRAQLWTEVNSLRERTRSVETRLE
jgi:phage shock protein A